MDQRARARILLVDDTDLSRDLVATILERSGFAVDVAADGATACELTWSKRYDLVLMDLEMPGMSGYEAAARIRAREGVMSGVLIAAFTASHKAEAEQLSLWSGIDAFIAKPVLPALLVARIEAMVAGRHDGGDDWRPVWRLHAFETCGRDMDAAKDRLDELEQLFDRAAEAIHVHATGSDRFLHLVARLCDLAERYGFDEIAGLCAFYREPHPGLRSRDPNLLGAIGRARYAIAVWRHDHPLPPALVAGDRTRVTVRHLFAGRRAAA